MPLKLVEGWDAGDADPVSDIFDIKRTLTLETEFASFGDFQAMAGHLFPAENHKALWDLSMSWLFRANRNPKLSDFLMAAFELEKKSTAMGLRARGAHLGFDQS